MNKKYLILVAIIIFMVASGYFYFQHRHNQKVLEEAEQFIERTNEIKEFIIGHWQFSGTHDTLTFFKNGSYHLYYSKEGDFYGTWALHTRIDYNLIYLTFDTERYGFMRKSDDSFLMWPFNNPDKQVILYRAGSLLPSNEGG